MDDEYEAPDWDAETQLAQWEAEQERVAELSPADWFAELCDEVPSAARLVDRLCEGGVRRIDLIEGLREVADVPSPYSRTTAKALAQIRATARRLGDQLWRFLFSDGPSCMVEGRRIEPDDCLAVDVILAKATEAAPGFARRLKSAREARQRAIDRLTLLVDMKVKAHGRVNKRAQHEALAELIEIVTEKSRTVHAQRVSTSRAKARRGIKRALKVRKRQIPDQQREFIRDRRLRKKRRSGAGQGDEEEEQNEQKEQKEHNEQPDDNDRDRDEQPEDDSES